MTQKELAQLIEVDTSSIRNYETGRSTPRSSKLGELEEALQISLSEPVPLMTPEHLQLKPDGIREDDWRSELQSLYESWLQMVKDQAATFPPFPTPNIEANAAILARQTQLWGHDVVAPPFRGGVSYRLVTDKHGKRDWKSNVQEESSEGADRQPGNCGSTEEPTD